MRQLPSSLAVPFCLSHRSGYTKELEAFIQQHLSTTISARGTCQLLAENRQKFHHDRCHLYSSVNHTKGATVQPSFREWQGCFPTASFMTSHSVVITAYVHQIGLLAPMYHMHMANLTIDSEAAYLTCDHTFKTAVNIGMHRTADNKWVPQRCALFCVLNSAGQVLTWKLTHSIKFACCSDVLEKLHSRVERQHRVAKEFVVDNCCSWRRQLQSLFGPHLTVMLDLFHATQRVLEKIPKRHKMRALCTADFCNVFRYPADRGTQRTMATPPPDMLAMQLDGFLQRWRRQEHDGIMVLSSAALKEIAHLHVHIQRGCLSGLRPGQGTNCNEGLHRLLNSMNMSARYGPELAATRLMQAFFKRNEEIEALQQGRTPQTIQEYAATTVSTTIPETFGLLPEVPVDEPCTTATHTEQSQDPLPPIPCILAGPGSVANAVGAGSAASSKLSVEQQQKAEEHAVRALTYQHIFSQISAQASTQAIDYRRFAFLELASDTFTTSPLSTAQHSSHTLDSVVHSYGLCKTGCPLPPLAAVTRAAFSQLTKAGSVPDVQQFFMELLCADVFPTEFDVFHAQALAAIQEYIATCDLPILISPASQHSLSRAITANKWADTQFLDVVLRCAASTLHTPIIMITSATEFPLVPYIPQEPPLSGLQPIYLGVCVEEATAFWILSPHPNSSTVAPSSTGPTPKVTGSSHASTSTARSTEGSSTSEAEVETMPNHDCNDAATTCPSAHPLPTVQVQCNCGHTTRTANVCSNQPGLTSSRCPCLKNGLPCNALCSCRSCQNPFGPAARTPSTGVPAASSNTTVCKTPAPAPVEVTNPTTQKLQQNSAVHPTPVTLSTTKCRCGQTSPQQTACMHRPGAKKSRCPCLKAGRACMPACQCCNCGNPHGCRPGTMQHMLPDPSRKRCQPTGAYHQTQKRKASDFLAAEALAVRTGTHTSLEYFLVLSIVETEFGLLTTDALPGDELLALYTAACASITSITSSLPIYPRSQATVLQLAKLVRRNYSFTAVTGLTM